MKTNLEIAKEMGAVWNLNEGIALAFTTDALDTYTAAVVAQAKEQLQEEVERLKEMSSVSKVNDGWTCYHCGEHFVTHTHAKLHFGIERTGALPACLIKGSEGGLVKYIRELEERLIPYQNEDTELMRSLSRQRCESLNAIASAEEVGYSRGLKEYEKIRTENEQLRSQVVGLVDALKIVRSNELTWFDAKALMDKIISNSQPTYDEIVKSIEVRMLEEVVNTFDNCGLPKSVELLREMIAERTGKE